MPMLDFFAAYWDYEEAKAAMIAAPPGSLAWPWDPLRDAVQGQGMRFCYQWKKNAETIATMVQADPERFPEFHTPDKKGNMLDPRLYQNHHLIMPHFME